MGEAPLDLSTVADERSSDLEQKLSEILSSTLKADHDATPIKAAREINLLCPLGQSEEAGEAEAFIWRFWTLVIRTAQVVPSDHPGQNRLVSVLDELTGLPPSKLEIWGVRRYSCTHFWHAD